jgi:hypothetical protein
MRLLICTDGKSFNLIDQKVVFEGKLNLSLDGLQTIGNRVILKMSSKYFLENHVVKPN